MFTTGLYNSFEADMVVTVEQFTYQLGVIAIKMVGIAVRIEDDILITANGP
jgi:Xaa-Pro aminopeptidase